MPYFKIFSVILICLVSTEISSQTKGVESENRLFYIERSKNRNLVCYDINLEENGTWNSKQPLEVYWVNQEERPGQTNGLSGIEKKFAYGYKVISRDNENCTITLTAYPNRELTIRKKENKYICTVTIDGQPAILQKLYVKSKAGNSLSVEYVELTGVSISTGQLVSERVSK